MQKPWSLYNKEDKLRVDDLTSEQVRIVLLATASKRMSHWYACQEGDVHWQPVSAIPEFYEDVRQIKGKPDDDDDRDKELSITQTSVDVTPDSVTMKIPTEKDAKSSKSTKPTGPPVISTVPRRPLFEDPPDDPTAPTLQVDFTRTKERRTARRYPRRLNFKTTIEGKVFECGTVDVSMAGLSLDQDLPAWIPKNFSAELSMNQHAIKVMCSKVGEKKLKLKDSSSWDVIRAWIVNW